MPEKIAVLARMIIFPNTNYPESRAFIIACVDIDFECYLADTDLASIHKDFWSKDLTNEQKVPAIQAMLNALEMANGHRFRYIQPLSDDELDGYPSTLK
jgi:hypothetical protein